MLNPKNAEALEKFLQPFYGPIREAILDGFRYRQRRYAEELSNHTPRTRASLINDLIVVEFMKRALKKFGIKVMKVKNRILFDIQGQVILHFKKLNRALLSSNLQTNFAFAFTRQMELPGIPTQLPRLIAGYIPTVDWTALEGVYITLPNGDEIEWKRSLLEEPTTLTQLEEPLNEKTEEPKRRKRNIRRRKGRNPPPPPNEETGTDD